MSAPFLLRLRNLWRDVHLWLGVGLLVATIPLGITGSVLTFRGGLERMVEPQRFAASDGPARRPLSDYMAAARTAMGERATPAQVRLPGPEGGPVMVSGPLAGPQAGGGRRAPQLAVWLDPQSLTVREIGNPRGGTMQFLHTLHGNLQIPDIGRQVVGWVGVAMFISCITGLWLWWPLQGGVLRGFRWRRGPGTLSNLHHQVGFWICIPLAILSLTGIYLSFPQQARALFGVEEARPEGARGAGERARGAEGGAGRRVRGERGGGGGRDRPLANPSLTIDDAAQRALNAAGTGSQLVQVTWPTGGRSPSWRVQLRPAGVAEPVNYAVSDANGEARLRTSGQGIQDPLSRWMRRLHDGQNLPFWWKLIIFLGGLAPAILSLTGLVMWLQRRGRAATASARREERLAAE